MQVQDIQQALREEPFSPFYLRLDDGRAIRVAHREAVALTPKGRSIVVMQQDGSTDRIDILHIVSIDSRSGGTGRSATNGKRRKSA